VHFLVPLISRETRRIFEDTLYRHDAQDLPLTILFGHAHLAMTAADGVLLASGTATLEAALLKRPMVVTYKMPWLSYVIGRSKVVVPYVSLPNVLAGRFVVPEIFQDEATPAVLAQALINQLGDKQVRTQQERAFLEMHRALRQNTSERVVEAILPLLRQVHPSGPRESLREPAGAVGT
jgi:lipid-A-disaccharide synthase